jgi:hypothetical protein
MVYTDRVHLVADHPNELHDFAEFIGLPKSYFSNLIHPHYILVGNHSLRAIDSGALVINDRKSIEISIAQFKVQRLSQPTIDYAAEALAMLSQAPYKTKIQICVAASHLLQCQIPFLSLVIKNDLFNCYGSVQELNEVYKRAALYHLTKESYS